MTIQEIIDVLEKLAPTSLQESYDNAGLITGNSNWQCTGVLCTLDSTENIIEEAIQKNCNLVVAHHPIIFKGLKKINGKNYVERTIIRAIKHDIAIYAIHTNLDNIIEGVNGRMADKLELVNRRILSPKESTLKKLFCFVPFSHAEKVREALFSAGAGVIGNYTECSFGAEGNGTFKAREGADPFVGKVGEGHLEKELKLEVVFPASIQTTLIRKMKEAHPYQEVAYDIVALDNPHPEIGSGIVGQLPSVMAGSDFLQLLKSRFGLSVIRHTALPDRPIQKVAICGGAGSFLINNSLSVGADAFITSDLKYHEFFEADGKILFCDLGHFETEQFTIELLADILRQKFPTFAILKSDINTNPVYYYF